MDKIYIAGHTGLVGSAILRNLKSKGYTNFVFTPYPEYDLTDQKTVSDFFQKEKPEYVFLAAAKVGGIMANNTYRAQFIYENIQIQNNIIHQSYLHGVKKLLFLGSSCIYPKNCPQPIKEEYLLTSELEYTNEPYAIAKIAGLKMCEAYNMQYGTNFISVMPTNLYGPNDNYDLEKSHVLPALIRKMHLARCLENSDWQAIKYDLNKRPVEGIDGKADEKEILSVLAKYGINKSQISNLKSQISLLLWGSGTPRREFLHANDLADACVFLMENINFNDLMNISYITHQSSINYDEKQKTIDGGCKTEEEASPIPHLPSFISHPPSNVAHPPSPIKNTHINIGTGKDLTIKELAYMIKEITGFKGNIEWDTTKPDGTMQKLLNVDKLHNLGWKESVELKEGIKDIYNKYSI